MMLESQSSALTVSPIPPQDTTCPLSCFFRIFCQGLCIIPAQKLALAFLVLGIPAWNIPDVLQPLFTALASGVTALLGFSMEGTRFLFGDLAVNVSTMLLAFIGLVALLNALLGTRGWLDLCPARMANGYPVVRSACRGSTPGRKNCAQRIHCLLEPRPNG